MGLMDDLNEELAEVSKSCPAQVLLASLSEEDREPIKDALVDMSVPLSRLLNVLRRNGYKLGDQSAYNHRNGVCRCR